MRRKRSLLAGIGTVGGKKSVLCPLRVLKWCWGVETHGGALTNQHFPPPPIAFSILTQVDFFFFSLLEACKPLMNSRSYPWSRWPGCQKTVWHQVNLFLTTTWGVGCGARGDVGPSHSLMEAPVCLNSHGKISKASHKSQREPGLSLKFLFHYCCFQAFPERLQK